MKYFIRLFFSLCIAFDYSYSQRLIDRNLILNPLNSKESPIDFNAFGEFGMYRIQRDNSHSWLQKLGIVIDFYKTTDFAFSGVSSIEFISDPHNDIRFNPRAIFWDEGFFITKRISKNFFQLGYFHRCKHDIDNFFTGYERTLIYGSITGKLLLQNLLCNNYGNLLQLRTDIYTIKFDHKYPKINRKVGYDKLVASIGLNFYFNFPLWSNVNFVANSNLYISLYSDNKNFFEQFSKIHLTSFNYGLGFGLGIGEDNMIKVKLNYEQIDDPGIDLQPGKSKLFYFSLLFSDAIVK